MILLCYEKCSTCKTAIKHLKQLNVDFEIRDITQKISVEELKKWIPMSNKTVNQFFNTSGLVYRNNNYKEKLPNMSDEEKYEALSSDGMLVKRPILIGDDFVLVGYKKEEYEKIGERYGK